MRVGNRYSAINLHDESGIGWLGTSRAKSTCIEVFKVLHGNCSADMSKSLHIVKPVRILRSNAKINVSKRPVRTKLGEGDFCYRGPKYWDLLDGELQNSKNLNVFKKRIKTCTVFDKAAYTHYKNVHYL